MVCAALLAPSVAATAPASAAPAPTLWGCHPNQTPNPCFGSLDTTVLASTSLQLRRVARVEHPQNAAAPKVDCFYVYPTVTSTLRVNAKRSLTHEVASILKFQAARFSQECRVFAPVYRQVTLPGIVATASDKTHAASNLAYGDVLAAWREYLANDNHGRGVVFVSHSQGTQMLIRLLSEEIDPNPAARAKLVSAVLLGGNLAVAKGERAGGDFQAIPTCASGDETGCAIAYSAFAKQPGQSSLFGRVNGSLRRSFGLPTDPEKVEVACVNPADLSGDNGRFETYTRSETFPGLIGASLNLLYLGLPPKASTPWVRPGERYRGACVHSNGAHVLMVKAANPFTIVPLASPTPEWGLHLADMNLPLGNLLRVVHRQIDAYSAGSAHAAG